MPSVVQSIRLDLLPISVPAHSFTYRSHNEEIALFPSWPANHRQNTAIDIDDLPRYKIARPAGEKNRRALQIGSFPQRYSAHRQRSHYRAQCPVPSSHLAAANNDVLTGHANSPSIGIAAGLDGDAVVAGIEKAVFDQHITTRFEVATVGVGTEALQVHATHRDVFTQHRIQQPKGRRRKVEINPITQMHRTASKFPRRYHHPAPTGVVTSLNGASYSRRSIFVTITQKVSEDKISLGEISAAEYSPESDRPAPSRPHMGSMTEW